MRKLLFIALTILTIACKKEDTNPSSPSTPVTPAVPGLNYFILNGDGYTNDTFFIETWQTGLKIDSSGYTRVGGYDSITTCSFLFHMPTLTADTFSVTSAYQSSVSASNGGNSYNVINLNGRITRYDNVNGLIEGTMAGTCQNVFSLQPASFSGVFSVKRIQ